MFKVIFQTTSPKAQMLRRHQETSSRLIENEKQVRPVLMRQHKAASGHNYVDLRQERRSRPAADHIHLQIYETASCAFVGYHTWKSPLAGESSLPHHSGTGYLSACIGCDGEGLCCKRTVYYIQEQNTRTGDGGSLGVYFSHQNRNCTLQNGTYLSCHRCSKHLLHLSHLRMIVEAS